MDYEQVFTIVASPTTPEGTMMAHRDDPQQFTKIPLFGHRKLKLRIRAARSSKISGSSGSSPPLPNRGHPRSPTGSGTAR